MGRETKILLALLATLTGVFVGVLSIKLFSPRPPVGAGPDVHIDVAGMGENELVAPPSLSPPAPGPSAAEPAFAEAVPPARTRSAESVAESRFTTAARDLLPPPARFDAPSAAPVPATQTAALNDDRPMSPPAVPAAPPRRDPFVAPAGLQTPITQAPITEQETPDHPVPAAAAAYVANSGDSWWDLAERAYGDGRLYRALFAWNRVIDPRVTLAPGTRLEIPTRSRLEAAWPKLMPAE